MPNASTSTPPSENALPELRARFCWAGTRSGREPEVGLFRHAFELDTIPTSLRVLVSADSRYILWLNGQRIGRGPLKGTLQHYHAETYELAPHLKQGRNILAAEVRWFGNHAAESEVQSDRPGFFVQDLCRDTLDTPGSWKMRQDDSISPGLDDPYVIARMFLGPLDRIDAERRPRNWMEPGYDDADWEPVVATDPIPKVDAWGVPPRRLLTPREIPALLEEPHPFSKIWEARRESELPWRLEAGEAGEIWLDAGSLTTSYPVLEFHGGAGREVEVVYAEALGRWEEHNGGRNWRKSDRRDDIDASEPHGYRDVVRLSGGEYTFEPFHWRTFWFIKIRIEPGPEPVELRAASHRFTTYPQEFTAQFTCAAPDIGRMWKVSLHTLRLCAHETYEDCPYFEQLSYIGDTRLQALCSFYLANQTTLARRSLRLFRDTLGPDGLLASRAPSRTRQVIPSFSLQWILMLGDYWEWVGQTDAAFVRSCLGAMDSILAGFRHRIDAKGFVGRVEGWGWVDWVPEWEKGVQPVVADGASSTVFTGWFIQALDTASKLHRAVGWSADAERWSALAGELRRTLRRDAWSESAGLFLEGPGRESDAPSQHAQIAAILADAADARQIERIRARLLDDPKLAQVSMYQRYHLARALEKTGDYARFFSDVLQPWREALAKGLQTWPETPGETRSDCHAWASWIVVDFFANVLGVRAAAPGWKAIRLQPWVCGTDAAAGRFSTPAGLIEVRWERDPDKGLTFHAQVPAGVPTTVLLPDGSEHVFESGGAIHVAPGATSTPALAT